MCEIAFNFYLVLTFVTLLPSDVTSNDQEEFCPIDSDSCNGLKKVHRPSKDDISKLRFVDSSGVFEETIRRAYDDWTSCSIASTDSCETCFDGQIDFDLIKWTESGISEDQVNQAKYKGVHYQVIENKLYRQKDCYFPGRCEGIEHFILKIINQLPNLEFLINVRDWPQVPCGRSGDCSGIDGSKILPLFSFSKISNKHHDILYPAWAFWTGGPAIDKYPRGIGNWNGTRNLIVKKSSLNWDEKINITFFRGSRTSPERDPIVLFSANYPKLLDAKYTKNQAWRSKADTLGHDPAPTVTFEDQCKYKYLLNVRGVAASFRYKHLFLCKSLVLNIESDWIEFFYPLLKPWIHYIPVKEDFSNYHEIFNFIRANDDYAQIVAENGFQIIWQHLTMESATCYWKNLLLKYSKLLKYKPNLDQQLIRIF